MFFNAFNKMNSRQPQVVMYDDLSVSAQEKILMMKGVSSPADAFLDIIPIAYIHSDFANMLQDELDNEALTQAGYYRLTL